MLQRIAFLGILFFTAASCTSGGPKPVEMEDLVNAPNGNYKVHVHCLSETISSTTISDKTGALKVRSDYRCSGQYGEALIAVQGPEMRMYRFTAINQVQEVYPLVRAWKVPGVAGVAEIVVDGKIIAVELEENGSSDRVLKTNHGYIRP